MPMMQFSLTISLTMIKVLYIGIFFSLKIFETKETKQQTRGPDGPEALT